MHQYWLCWLLCGLIFSACAQKTESRWQKEDLIRIAQTQSIDLTHYPHLSLHIYKSRRILEIQSDTKPIKYFPIGLGFAPAGDKEKEGDGKTPNGSYYVCRLLANSSYHKAFLLSYPDLTHAKIGLQQELITEAQHLAIEKAWQLKRTPPQNTALGGLIEIHGNGSQTDWTLGCIALENFAIDELWAVIPLNTNVTITE